MTDGTLPGLALASVDAFNHGGCSTDEGCPHLPENPPLPRKHQHATDSNPGRPSPPARSPGHTALPEHVHHGVHVCISGGTPTPTRRAQVLMGSFVPRSKSMGQHPGQQGGTSVTTGLLGRTDPVSSAPADHGFWKVQVKTRDVGTVWALVNVLSLQDSQRPHGGQEGSRKESAASGARYLWIHLRVPPANGRRHRSPSAILSLGFLTCRTEHRATPHRQALQAVRT